MTDASNADRLFDATGSGVVKRHQTESLERLRRTASALQSSAHALANDLGCVVSWSKDVDPEEDARDPHAMRMHTLTVAEDAARKLLDGITKARMMAVTLPTVE